MKTFQCRCGKELKISNKRFVATKGRRTKCPKCGASIQIPKDPKSPLVVYEKNEPEESTQPREPQPAAFSPAARKRSGWLHPVKILMIGATVAWPLGAIGIAVLGYSSHQEQPKDRLISIGGGEWINIDTGRKTHLSPEDRDKASLAASLFSGVCFSTSAYAATMTVLFVTWFIFKPQ